MTNIKLNRALINKIKHKAHQVKIQNAREIFWNYCVYMDNEFANAEKRPHLKKMADALQKLHENVYERISFSLPPRYGKSYMITLFVTWQLGKRPNRSIMRNTCVSDLYDKLSGDTRDIVRSEKFKEVFPNVRIDENMQNIKRWRVRELDETGHIKEDVTEGYFFGNGVGGSIIGLGATGYAITDDLYKDIETALTPTYREKTKMWLDSAHESRTTNAGGITCKVIDIGTRWHKEDAIGLRSKRKRDDGSDFYDCQVIIPALDENGESTCPEVKTTAQYREIRKNIDPLIWQAEYMQQPIDAQGVVFHDEHLKKFYKDGMPEGRNIAYIDVADKGTDYLSMPIATLVMPKSNVLNYTRLFIHDVLFTQAPIEETVSMVVDKIFEYNIKNIQIESNNDGHRFYNDVQQELQFRNRMLSVDGKPAHYCDLTMIRNTSNKLGRILLSAGEVKKACHFLHHEEYDQYGQYKAFMKQFTGFSRLGGSKHDDAPDSVVGLVDMISNMCIVHKVHDISKNRKLTTRKFS
jgi:predicted phage terminase large subunit-like protein